MKQTKRRGTYLLRFVLGAIASVLLVYFALRVSRSCAPETIEIVYKHIYSNGVQRKIDCFIKTYVASLDCERVDPAFLCEKLKDMFKIVKRVSWNWDSLEKAVLVVEGIRPVLRVNDQMVCGEERTLFPYDCFSNTTLDEIKLCSIESSLAKGKVDAIVYKFLENMPQQYWESYEVSYVGYNYVELKKRDETRRLQVIIDACGAYLDKKKMDMVTAIYDDFLKNRWSNAWRGLRKNEYVVCDLRFKDRIYAKVTHL